MAESDPSQYTGGRADYSDTDLVFRVGHEEVTVFRRYEAASIANDFLIALWFLAGSVLDLFEPTQALGKTLFVIGSLQFLLRPCIHLAHHFRVRYMPDSYWHL